MDKIKKINQDTYNQLCSNFKEIHPLIINLFMNRKIDTVDKINDFLNIKTITNPFNLKNMQKICERIEIAIQKNEKIIICGDYDADGTVSTAMLVRFFREIGVTADYYIPHRIEEGYGISAIGVQKLHEERNPNLLISVDNGIVAFDAADKARELGIDLIITDHHDLLDDKIPDCYAVLNPKQEGETSYRYLAGAGVALYLIRALKRHLNSKVNLDKYLILAIIASVADVVPLTQENRVLVKKGLDSFEKSFDVIGLIQLFKQAGINLNYLNQIKAQDIGFKIAPLLNAAGRLEGADKAIQLLISDNEAESENLAIGLKNLNIRRRAETDLLLAQIKNKIDLNSSVIIEDGDYHPGVIGIVAGRLKNEFHKPAIVISFYENSDIGKASCRSIQGFNIKKALDECKDFYISGGGHYMAAGFSIHRNQLENFKKAMNANFDKLFNRDLYEGDLIDFEVSQKDLTNKSLITQLKNLEPFGATFEYPIISYKGKITNINVVKNEHLMIQLDHVIEVWYFFQNDKLKDLQSKLYIEVIGELSVKGNKFSLIAKDIV